jgi:hypothetical protein
MFLVDRNKEGGEDTKSVEFEEVFTPDMIDSVVSYISKLVQEPLTNVDSYQESFATHLYKLGIRLQNDSLINQAATFFPNLAPIDQLDVYSKLARYYRENPFFPNPTSGEELIKKALIIWRESLISRIQDGNAPRGGGYGFFYPALRLMSTLIQYNYTTAFEEVKQGCLTFIASSSRNLQPLLFVSLAERLREVEDKTQLLEYLKKADTIVQDSSQTQHKNIEADLQQTLTNYFVPQATQQSSMLGSSLFDLQLALAHATKDSSILKSLLTSLQNMEMMQFPFSSIPLLLIAKEFHQLGDPTSARSLLQEVLDDLSNDNNEMMKLAPEANMFTPIIVMRFEDICLELNEKELAQKVRPILTKSTPNKRFSHFVDIYKETQSKSLPDRIIGAYKKENFYQADSLLGEYEKTIYDQIEMAKSPPNLSNLRVKMMLGDKDTNRLLKLSMLAKVYVEVNKTYKLAPILKQLHTYLEANEDKLITVIKTTQPAPPLLQLFRTYHFLQLKLGYTESEINDIIKDFQKFDPQGLIDFGVNLAKTGHVEQALKISESKTSQSMRGGTWDQYFQAKTKFLKSLGEFEKTKEVTESTFEPFLSNKERWRFDAHQLDQCLFLEDQGKIKQIINLGISSLNDPIRGSMSSFSFISPLIMDHPPQDVKQEIWQFARDYLKDQLLPLIEFQPGDRFRLSFTQLSKILLFLAKLNSKEIVKEISLQILSTLQEAIRNFAPKDLIAAINFSSAEANPLDYNALLNSTFSRTNLLMVATRDDYWVYYKTMGESGALTYDEFNLTYGKWFGEQRTGKSNDMHLYLNVPFVYFSLVKIFDILKEKEFVTLCRNTLKVLQEYRWKAVQEDNTDGRIDRGGLTQGLANLLTLAKFDLEAALKSHNYLEARRLFTLTFELLTHESLKTTGRSGGLALDPTLLSVLEMFELLSKY